MTKANPTCKVLDCNNDVRSRGLCLMHYKRLLRHGDPLKGRVPNGKAYKFLVESVSRANKRDCLIWPFPKRKDGYAIVTDPSGQRYRINRLSLILTVGEPQGGSMHACHAPLICHNPSCYNPHHLRWATRSENMNDRVLDGTSNRGVRCASSKLTNEQVLDIKKSDLAGYLLARKYGVNRNTIYDIKNNRTWQHLD